MLFAWVGIGGAVGALLRFQLTKWIGERFAVSFPLATLLINVSGSFMLGLLARTGSTWFPQHASQVVALLGVGLCGAYTTFSTFNYELTILLRERRITTALTYLAVSLLGGFAASAVGLYGLPTHPIVSMTH